MKQIYILMAMIGALLMASAASATPATDALFAQYKSEGATGFDAERGRKDWTRDGKEEDGKKMNCTICHGDDLSKAGKHHKTGKLIEPMAPSVNPQSVSPMRRRSKNGSSVIATTFGVGNAPRRKRAISLNSC